MVLAKRHKPRNKCIGFLYQVLHLQNPMACFLLIYNPYRDLGIPGDDNISERGHF